MIAVQFSNSYLGVGAVWSSLSDLNFSGVLSSVLFWFRFVGRFDLH